MAIGPRMACIDISRHRATLASLMISGKTTTHVQTAETYLAGSGAEC